jgi:hypothetical protein
LTNIALMKLSSIVVFIFLSSLISCNFFKGESTADTYLANDLDSLDRPSLPMPTAEQVLLSLVQDSSMHSGLVQVRIVIDEYGKVRSPKIVNSLGRLEDSVVLARVNKLPDFIPGRIHGRPVKTVYFMAFIFNPDGSSDTSR